MNIFVFILFLFGLQALCLIIGGKSSKGLKNQEDYFLAGKNIRFLPLMMTFLATQVGGGMILGSSEEAYRYGWSILFYPLGTSLGLIALGLGFGRLLAQFKVSTVAQIFEVAYKSAQLKKIASVLSVVSLFMILVAQIIASNKFMVSLGLESPLWFLAFWCIVIFYTSMGGLKAVVASDIIQASFYMVIFAMIFGCVFFTSDTSFKNFDAEIFTFESSKLYGWLLMPLLFMVIEQDMGQRCFAADSPRTVSKATIIAGILAFMVSFVSVYLGVLGKTSGIEVPAGASVLMTVVKETTNPILAALLGSAILGAIISTSVSLINAVGSNLSQDFDAPLLKNNIGASRLISAGIAVAALIFSSYFNNVVDLLIQSYELSVSCLFIPIFIALFKREGNTGSAGLAVAFGAVGFIVFRIFPTVLPKEVLSVMLSSLGYFLGEMLARRRIQEVNTLN